MKLSVVLWLVGCGARSGLELSDVDAGLRPCDGDGDGHLAPECGGDDCDDCDSLVYPSAHDPPEEPWRIDDLLPRSEVPGRWLSIAAASDGLARVAVAEDGRLLVGPIDGGELRADDVDASGGNPSMALADDGVVHVAYEGDSGLSYATNRSGSWEIEPIDGEETGRFSALVVAPDGVHIVYTLWRGVDGYALRHARRAAGGWEIQTIDDARDSGWNPSIAVDDAGILHVAYCRYEGGEPGAVLHAQTDGAGWSTEVLDEGRNVGAQPSVAIDARGEVHLTYYAFVDGDPRHRGLHHAVRSGGVWTSALLEEGSNVGFFSALAPSGCGVDAIWHTDGGVRHGTHRTGEWVARTVDALPRSYLALAVDGGDAHAAYREIRGPGLLYARGDVAHGIDQDCDGEDE